MTQIKNPYQAFTITANGVADRVITDIEVTEAYDSASTPDPLPTIHRASALWDTGASRSVISPAVVNALGLSAVGSVMVHHAGGSGTSPTYMVNFKLPNKVGIIGPLVTESPLQGFDVLIGMDVIALGDLSLTHAGGKTCMSFRIPSIGGTDFVLAHKAMLRANVGRNDPCPCGKTLPDGRPVKFKNCCWN